MITALRRTCGRGLVTGSTSAIREMAMGGGAEASPRVRPDVASDENPLILPTASSFLHAPTPAKTGRRYYSTPPRDAPGATTPKKKVTVLTLQQKYRKAKPISMITCYDYPTATIIDDVGVDIILVGDSVGMVVHGHESTVPVTVDDIIAHCQAVTRGAKHTFVIGDMPFGSFEATKEDAVRNALRIVKEGGVDAVKLEGGRRMASTVEAIVNAGVLVQGHIGLTPQSAAAMGGFRVQGKSVRAAEELLEDARALEAAGCFSIVIEGVPSEVAEYITKNINVPTIGIGAGKETSGQVLVLHDMCGLNPGRTPKFCKKYADVMGVMRGAIQEYVNDVGDKSFPSPEYCYKMPDKAAAEMQKILAGTPPNSDDDGNGGSGGAAAGGAPFAAAPPQSGDAGATNAAAAQVQMKIDRIDRTPIRKSPIVPTKKIAVIGGGAMGSFIGGSLARIGTNSVWMVSDWTDHVQAISSHGLRLDSFSGATSSVINTLRATSDINHVLEEDGYMDMVFILVKSPNTSKAAQKAAKLVHPEHGMITTLQNGVGNREAIIDVFEDADRVVGGVSAHGAMLMGEAHVQHTGMGTTTIAVPSQGAGVRRRVEDIAHVLTLAGIDTSLEAQQRMESMVWGKLIINAGINPLSALFRVKNGVLAENAVCRDLLERTVDEAATVAKMKNIVLPFANPIDAALNVARKTAANKSSMLCDMLRGVTTEIDAINGAIVREGKGLGIDTPTNASLVAMVRGRQQLATM